MTGISCHPDIEYAQIPGFRPLELDLYLPDPVARSSPDPVPVVVHVHGGGDTLVPPDQSIRFARALQDAGGTVSLVLVPGASHFWDGADDVPGLVARSADFAHSLAPLEV